MVERASPVLHGSVLNGHTIHEVLVAKRSSGFLGLQVRTRQRLLSLQVHTLKDGRRLASCGPVTVLIHRIRHLGIPQRLVQPKVLVRQTVLDQLLCECRLVLHREGRVRP